MLLACALLAHHMQAQAPAQAAATRFTTLPGFVVERVTPPEKTSDSCINMTFDSLGRPVLSKEGGGPRTLVDTNGDGIYDGEIVFSEAVRDCQGFWFDGRTLYGVCVGPADRLYRLEDTDGDDVAETVEWVSTLTGGTGGAGPHLRRQVHDLLVDRFPSDDERWNREVALTLAYCGQPGAIAKILAAMPPRTRTRRCRFTTSTRCAPSVTAGRATSAPS